MTSETFLERVHVLIVLSAKPHRYPTGREFRKATVDDKKTKAEAGEAGALDY